MSDAGEERGDFESAAENRAAADREDRGSEHIEGEKPEGTIVSGFTATPGDRPARSAQPPAGPPPEEARHDDRIRHGNPTLDPAALSDQVDATDSADPQDRPAVDDGYIERPAGRDAIEAGATDLDDQVRSEHA